MKPYAMDLRERAVAACDAREGTREQIAERFSVGERWIRKVLQQRRETGSITPLTWNPGRKRALNDRQTERLRCLNQKRPDATLKELRKSLGVKISIAALDRAIRRLDVTLRKSRSRRRSRSRSAASARFWRNRRSSITSPKARPFRTLSEGPTTRWPPEH